MKRLLFLSYILSFTTLCAQTISKDSGTNFRIPPSESFSERYEVMRGDNVNLQITINKSPKHGQLLKSIPGLLTFGTRPITNGARKEAGDLRSNIPLNVSLVAGWNLFARHSRVAAVLEVKHFSRDGILISTDRLKRSAGKKPDVFVFKKIVESDGYMTLAIDNLIDEAVLVDSKFSVSKLPGKMTKPWSRPNPVPNYVAPDWPTTDGAWFDEVKIVGHKNNNTYVWKASFEANFGQTDTWSVSNGGTGGNNDNGNGDGGAGNEDPGPEEKAVTRDLNNIKANKCEARYILQHLIDRPLMALDLSNVKEDVETEMGKQDLREANSDGGSKQNAYKHALLYAYMYCAIGEQHADAIARYHEVCDGEIMGPADQEPMDTFNNARGKDIVKNVGCGDRGLIQFSVWLAYLNGVLHDINANPTSL